MCGSSKLKANCLFELERYFIGVVRVSFCSHFIYSICVIVQYEDAILCYLSIKQPRTLPAASSSTVPGVETDLSQHPYHHIFEIIEKKALFSVIEDKIINVCRLSLELAGLLLIRCHESLAIPTVARQLRSDRQLLYW
jgi:hypothetical protein